MMVLLRKIHVNKQNNLLYIFLEKNKIYGG